MKVFPHKKPCIKSNVDILLKGRDTALRSGDTQDYSDAQAVSGMESATTKSAITWTTTPAACWRASRHWWTTRTLICCPVMMPICPMSWTSFFLPILTIRAVGLLHSPFHLPRSWYWFYSITCWEPSWGKSMLTRQQAQDGVPGHWPGTESMCQPAYSAIYQHIQSLLTTSCCSDMSEILYDYPSA